MAYYFHWAKNEIMGMNMRERRIWLKQIERIHMEQKLAREREIAEQAEYFINLRAQEG